MQTHHLEFIPLDPQPTGHTRCAAEPTGEGTSLVDEAGNVFELPTGWDVHEATTQTLFGQVCWVRMVSPPYVPQDVATECMEALDAAGFGKPGTANTLWGMVMQACGWIDTAKGLLKGMRGVTGGETHSPWRKQIGTLLDG